MNVEAIVRWIGISHLLQPPATLALSRMLKLAPAFSALPALPGQIARNMAFASVGLPTSMGLLIAIHARDVARGGPMQSVAWLAAVFWSWRLLRQLSLARLWPDVPRRARLCHHLLALIFVVQGPVLGTLLAFS